MRPDELALLEHQVLMLRMEGHEPREVALRLGVKYGDVLSIMARLTKNVREENAGLAEELFMLSNMRLERLWRWVQSHLDKMETFDDKLVRAAVQVLDRQARMNGLDKQTRPGGQPTDDWVDAATPAEMDAYLRRNGFSIPDHVQVPA